MSPTPTPSPSPIPWLGDEGWNQHSSTLSDALAQQVHIPSTLTPAESAAFDQLMDGQPSNAAPIVAGVLISVLVLVAGTVAFIKRRRAHVTSPAPAEV